jgi:hypothetical protein
MEMIIFSSDHFTPLELNRKSALTLRTWKKKSLHLPELKKEVKQQPQSSLELKLDSP